MSSSKEKGYTFDKWCKDRIHRLPKPTHGAHPSPPSIVVKFTNYNVRKRVMTARRKPVGPPGTTVTATAWTRKTNALPEGVYINDSLTQQRSTLMYEGRQLRRQKLLSQIWTSDGKVVLKDHGNIRSAKTLSEIRNLLSTL